jgi:hypothetical protein
MPFDSSSARVSLLTPPVIRIDWMVVTDAGEPVIGTDTPLAFTNSVPVTLRETTMELGFASPTTLSTPPAALAVAAKSRRDSNDCRVWSTM